MRKHFKVSLEERRQAIDLLIEGKTVEEACIILRSRHHPKATIEEVQRVYFPGTGINAIGSLVGASAEVLNARFERMAEHIRGLKERATRLNEQLAEDLELRKKQQRGLEAVLADPERRASRAKRNAERQRELGIYNRRSEEYRRKWYDPLYRAKMVAYSTNPETRAYRSRQASSPEQQAKLTQGRQKYWEGWHQLSPEEQAPERQRRSNIAKNPQNFATREEGKQQFWEEWRRQPSEVRAQLVSPKIREQRRQVAMRPEIQEKFREGYRRYVESHRLLRAIQVYENPVDWEDEALVPVSNPDYANEVHQQETAARVHDALANLDALTRAVVCDLFDIDLSREGYPLAEIDALSEQQKDDLLRGALEKLSTNPELIRLISGDGGQ